MGKSRGKPMVGKRYDRVWSAKLLFPSFHWHLTSPLCKHEHSLFYKALSTRGNPSVSWALSCPFGHQVTLFQNLMLFAEAGVSSEDEVPTVPPATWRLQRCSLWLFFFMALRTLKSRDWINGSTVLPALSDQMHSFGLLMWAYIHSYIHTHIHIYRQTDGQKHV